MGNWESTVKVMVLVNYVL